jgi:hypothetical protein
LKQHLAPLDCLDERRYSSSYTWRKEIVKPRPGHGCTTGK